MSATNGNSEYRSEVLDGQQDLQRFIGFDVVDCDGRKVGSVESIWEESSGEAAFISVRAGWLGLGDAHVVPAHRVGVNESRRKIKLPYDESIVKKAPTFEVAKDSMGNHYETVIKHYAAYDASLSANYESAVTAQAHRESRSGDETVQLKEERLQVGKREVQEGGYRLRKIVRTERVEVPVELRREELVIERVPVRDGAVTSDVIAEEDVYIPLRREEAVIAKEVRVREEVRAHVHAAQDTEVVVGEVAREDIEVEKVEEAESSAVRQMRDESTSHPRL